MVGEYEGCYSILEAGILVGDRSIMSLSSPHHVDDSHWHALDNP